MALEHQNYRLNLELVKEAYPGKHVLNMKEACEFLRLDRRTLLADKNLPNHLYGNTYRFYASEIAAYMCKK